MKPRLRDQLEIEHRISAGELPQLESSDLSMKAYEERIILGKARSSQALSELNHLDDLQKLKTLIHCGDLAQAYDLAQYLLLSFKDELEIRGEVLLELSRLHLYDGKWDQSIECSRAANLLHPPLVSQMTLWQIEAAALGERGDHAEALRRIEQVESLQSIFPAGNVLFYAQNQKVNLLAQVGRLAESERLLRDLWKVVLSPSSSQVSIDKIETLSRTELKLCTHLGLLGRAWARLSRKCCQLSGDQTFEMIGLADLAHNLKTLGETISENDYFRLLNTTSRRAKVIVEHYHLESLSTHSSSPPGPSESLDIRYVHLVEQGAVIDLTNLTFTKIDPESVISKALASLNSPSSTVRVEDFFQEVYGLSYHKGRHSGTLRTLMTRLRQNTQMPIFIKDGFVLSDYPFMVVGRGLC